MSIKKQLGLYCRKAAREAFAQSLAAPGPIGQLTALSQTY